MNVLVVLPPGSDFSTRQNSIETVVANLSRAGMSLRRAKIICDGGELPASTAPDDLDVIRLSPYRSKWTRTAEVILRVRQLGPDIIELHQHAPTAGLVSRFCASIPSVLYKHNFVRPSKNLIEKKIQEVQYSSFSRILFVSEAARFKFQGDFPGQAHMSQTLTNAIEQEGWIGDITRKEKLITYVGNAAPEKGFGELCDALTTILGKYTEWSVALIAGHWNIHSEWAERVSRPLHGFGKRFNLLKNQPKNVVQDWQKKSSISLVPSVYDEAFGLAALEAHLAGAAVISSGRGGLREVSSKYAYYVDEVTSSSLSDAIDRLISDPQLCNSFAREGQKYVLRTHRIEDRAKDLCTIENEMIKEFSIRG